MMAANCFRLPLSDGDVRMPGMKHYLLWTPVSEGEERGFDKGKKVLKSAVNVETF